MKYFLVLYSILILASGCKTYSYVEEYSLPGGTLKLPKLTVITDQEIFSSDSDEYRNTYSRSLGSASDIYVVERQFNKYALEHLSTWRSEQYGYAVLRINHLRVRNELPVLSFLSILTLGGSSLIGIPAGRYVVELDMSLEILDLDQKILGIYNGKGTNKAIIAMYYGYTEKDARDRCLYESLEQGFADIHEKVLRDFDRLESSLMKKDVK